MPLSQSAAPSASGGGGALELLASVTLGTAGTIDISAIPQTATDLIVVGMVRGARNFNADTLTLTLNGDGGSNYDYQITYGNEASGVFQGVAAQASIDLVDVMAAASAAAGRFSTFEAVIPGYTSTEWFKLVNTVWASDPVSASLLSSGTSMGCWLSTDAVTELTLAGSITANLVAGSSVQVYGRG